MSGNHASSESALKLLKEAESANQHLTSHFFDAHKSVDALFPSSEGLLRQTEIFQVHTKAENNWLAYNGDGGQRMIVHGVENKRFNAALLAAYVRSICNEGVGVGIRGEPWLCEPQVGQPLPYTALTFATLSGAVHQAN